MSVGDTAILNFIESRKSKFSGLDEDLADQRLNELQAATRLDDFKNLKSVNLHKLKGPLRNFWSVNINGP